MASASASPNSAMGSKTATTKSTADKPPAGPPPVVANTEGDDEDEQHMDVAFIQGFADKIQRIPAELMDGIDTARPKIVIPKRGEKDFEPLQETVNLQEMMLQKSRQALFDALEGVRGVAGKGLSHAVITPASPFPQLLVSRGHVLDSLGITIRRTPAFSSLSKPVSRVELLPEEALYLSERGTLQLWNGCDPHTQEEADAGVGAWCDEEFGVKGAVEMSLMEAFGAFMGKEGLTWQRYQAYAYLKRLGYTVQRTRPFIPQHFLTSASASNSPVNSTLAFLLQWPARVLQRVKDFLANVSAWASRMGSVGLSLCSHGTTIQQWRGSNYSSLFAHLRFIPSGHSNPVPPMELSTGVSIYSPLELNPYLPFFHVWKPVTAWSKAKWDRGSPEGISQQKPDYILAVVESRNTPLPTLSQLDSVFNMLPDEPTGPPRRVGPQYERKRPGAAPNKKAEPEVPQQQWFAQWLPQWLVHSSKGKASAPVQGGNALNSLRNGDRALIVAVNDSGNTGWVRFGRTGFENWAMA